MKMQMGVAFCACVMLSIGCSQQPSTETAAVSTAAAVDGSKFLLNQSPEDAQEVIQAREEAKDGDEVTLVGRIGGSANPWNEGRAIFSIVDNSLKACSDIPGDTCNKPWDYCCVSGKILKTSTALIKVVDERGNLVKADARDLLKVKELSTVVVKGKAKRDDAGNLTVLASGIYVKQD
jgi:hypothetical protein